MQLIEERDSLTNLAIEREHDAEEHALVLDRLKQHDGTKKAWMLVGDVLVERTVAEMIPIVTEKRDNLAALVENFKKQLESKKKEVLNYQEKYHIRIRDDASSGEEARAGDTKSASTSKPSKSSGVLVGS